MRKTCPECGSPERLEDWTMDFLVPDGWTLPTTNTVCMCKACGLTYYDNDATQADYDTYYRERYGFDGNLHQEANLTRLDELVALVAGFANKEDLIIDFGGGREAYLTTQLNKLGFANARTVEVGAEMPKNIDVLISSHVFEHLYNLREIVGGLVSALSKDGKFVVEVPDEWMEVVLPDPVPILDYHQKHINHFAPYMLDALMDSFGWQRTYQHGGPTPWYFGYHYRAVYEKDVARKMYYRSMMRVNVLVNAKLAKIQQEVHGQVVVWGCGDYCLHMLTKIKLDIAYFVDRDPAFRGATIGGVPVLETVITDHPIVIMAQNQQSGILHCIEQEGIKNAVIVI